LAAASADTRVERVEQYLREQVARLLGASAAALDVERPIMDLGLDSLIAVELTVVLERDFGVEMTGAALLGGFTIRKLASEVLGRMRLESSPAPAPVSIADAPPAVLAPAAPSAPAAPMPSVPPVTAPVAPSMLSSSGTDEMSDGLTTATPVSVNGNGNGNGAGRGERGDVAAMDYRQLDYSRWSASQQVIRRVFTAGFTCFARVDARGLEHIPSRGACILAVNHLSMVDVPLMLTLLPRRAIILAADRLRQSPILDWFVSDMGQAIYIVRGQAEEKVMGEARAVLAAGGVLALAPEGTRSRTGGLLRGHTGVAYLATEAGVPVVPVVAWGQEHWRTRWKRVSRLPISVRAGAPLYFPQGPATASELRHYTDQVMARMAEMLPSEYRGVYGSDMQVQSDEPRPASVGPRS
jgi:1-acyl-sn-glycerol-3-phosphate acyltransferase